jgi:hypothetical protein
VLAGQRALATSAISGGSPAAARHRLTLGRSASDIPRSVRCSVSRTPCSARTIHDPSNVRNDGRQFPGSSVIPAGRTTQQSEVYTNLRCARRWRPAREPSDNGRPSSCTAVSTGRIRSCGSSSRSMCRRRCVPHLVTPGMDECSIVPNGRYR